MSINEKMTAIADAIRIKTGIAGVLTLDGMAEAVNDINVGIDLPTLVNSGTAADLLINKQLITQDGTIITGTMPILNSNDIDITGNTVTIPNGYFASNTTATVNTVALAVPSISVTASGIITATTNQVSGYVSDGIKASTYALAFQEAKTIMPSSVSSVAVPAGYFTGGSVIVEGDSNLVASNIRNGTSIFGVYGTLAYNGDGDEIQNFEDDLIAKTISTYTNSRAITIGDYAFAYCNKLSAVDFAVCSKIGDYAFTRCSKLTSISFPACTTIGSYAFSYCSGLTTVSFPNCKTLGGQAFSYCYNLTSVSFPLCESIGNYAFTYCSGLTSANFPMCGTVSTYAFLGCSKLVSADFPACTTVGESAFARCSRLTTVSLNSCANIKSYAFYYCTTLKSLFLLGSSVCVLGNSNAFTNTPIGGYTTATGSYGLIYVPSSLITAYQTATNWTYLSSRFVTF